MAKARSELTWTEIDPASLPEVQAGLYQGDTAQYRAMKAAKEEFEASLQGGAPEGMRIVCGYNFSKLSLAMAPWEDRPKKVTHRQGSLSEFLARQAQAGRRL